MDGMTYRGTVRNGVVVFDAPTAFAEGTPVRVEALPAAKAVAATTPHFHPVGAWEGPPGELEQLLADVQSLRDADVDLERDAWK
jgi:hypothetical protein